MLEVPTRTILRELNETVRPTPLPMPPSPPKRAFATGSTTRYDPIPSTSALPKPRSNSLPSEMEEDEEDESEEEEEEEETGTETESEEEDDDETDQQTVQFCSQCKADVPLDRFPIRLATLTPFQVCKSHVWYWPEKKKSSHWAPDGASQLDEVCRDVATRLVGPASVDTWIVRGKDSDREYITQRVAQVGDWETEKL